MPEIITRKEAIERNLKNYFTGKSCKRNHISLRNVINSSCNECSKLHFRNRISKNPEWNRERSIEFYRRNTESINKKRREIGQTEADRVYGKLYRKKNRWLCIEKTARRRAKKLKATPSWANLDAIREFYLHCPKGYQVDHIIPLQNDLVCGLHVETNLQYLTKRDNLSKGSKFDVMYE